MHSLELSLLEQFPRQRWHDTRVLLAVSGGADSVALLRAVCRLAVTTEWIDVAHYNHRWRGAESDGDQAFVQRLCHDLGLRLHVNCDLPQQEIAASDRDSRDRVNAPAGDTELFPPHSPIKRSEEAARNARYDFLTKTAYRIGARYVLTAHTASDRVETLLHNLFRGTGLAGMAAPLSVRPLDDELMLVRPLLACTRDDIEDYLQKLGQAYRIDSSNGDERYRRNLLRHALLPRIREVFGDEVDERIAAFASMADELVQMHRKLAAEYMERNIEMWAAENGSEQAADVRTIMPRPGGEQLVVARERHLPTPWPIVLQALQMQWPCRGWSLKSMSRNHWNQLRDLWAESNAFKSFATATESRDLQDQLPGGLSVKQLNNWLIIH